VKFGFIAKHQGIWPAEWLCEALGVSRGGFYAWLTRPRSQRSRSDEELGAKVRASFLASDRTYGARRVWRWWRPDCVPGHVRFELRNVAANYLFERSHKFPGSDRILATETIRV
jgi:hypothetical protein